MFLWEFILNIPKRLSKLEKEDQDELKRELKHFKCGEMKHELREYVTMTKKLYDITYSLCFFFLVSLDESSAESSLLDESCR